MSHSLKNTWITILSILAMLMSSFVSSAPIMLISSMPSSDTNVAASHHNQKTVNHGDYDELTRLPHNSQHSIDCHSSDDSSQLDTQLKTASSHCDDFSNSADTCCVSVCASVYFPLDILQSPSILSPTLALHHPVKIGVKVSRIQSLLRPPSA